MENRTDPLVKQVTQFHSFLTTDMKRAVAYLDQVVKTLEAYAGVPTPGTSPAAPRPEPNRPAKGQAAMNLSGSKNRLGRHHKRAFQAVG